MAISSYPKRRYIPWLRWLLMVPTPLVLLLIRFTSVNIGLKLIDVLIIIVLWVTFYPIKQKFTFVDDGIEQTILARANIWGQITCRFNVDGEMKTKKLGRLSRTSQYLHFDVSMHGILQKFTLIHLGNTRYFFLSAQIQGATGNLNLVRNDYCF
jgi:hypothetical protein